MSYNSTIPLKHFVYKGKFYKEEIVFGFRIGNKIIITTTLRFPQTNNRTFIFISFKQNNIMKSNRKRNSIRINHLLRGF